jgi:2-polyprenyl-3-methyl-5-hydroxy-6-metoxy-1,4-benzoquinol methylase
MSNAGPDRADCALYRETARCYDRVRFWGTAGRWGHHRQIEILRGLADDWQGKKVLEIGCGTGRITEMLVQWGAAVTATDISAEMLEVAQARFRGRELSGAVRWRVMSVFDIDIELCAYDYIVMVNVFGRLSRGHDALRGIAVKMSDDCRLVFTFPCLTSILLPFSILVNARGKSLSRNVTSRWYTPAAIADCCRSAGLDLIAFHGHHYVPLPRFLFFTFPAFWVCDKLLAGSLPTLCPSVFVECRRSVAHS